MSIPAIGPVGFTPSVVPTLPTTASTPAAGLSGLSGLDTGGSTTGPAASSSSDFGSLLSQGMQNLQGLHSRTDDLALQAATGDLDAMHDYTITATEASVATQLTTAVRNKALEAFNEIMRMNV